MVDQLNIPTLNKPITPFAGWHLGSLEEVATEQLQGAVPMRVATRDIAHLSMLFHQFPRGIQSLIYLSLPEGPWIDDDSLVTYAGATWHWRPLRHNGSKASDQRSIPGRVSPLWGGAANIGNLKDTLDTFAAETEDRGKVVIVDKDIWKMRGYLRARQEEFGHVVKIHERGPAWYLFSTYPLSEDVRAQLDPQRLRGVVKQMVRVPRNCNSLAYLVLDGEFSDSYAFEPDMPASLTYGMIQRPEEEEKQDWSLSWRNTVRGPASDLLSWYEGSFAPPRGLVTSAPYGTTLRYLKDTFDVATVDGFRINRHGLNKVKKDAIEGFTCP